MLPDYPVAKNLIRKHQMKRLFSASNSAMGPFSDIAESPIHEGHRCGIIRENGQLDEMKWKKIQVSRKIDVKEAEAWSEQDVDKQIEEIGAEIGRQKKELTYDGINDAVEVTGNQIDANGPPSAELLLKTYQKMWIEFDEKGMHVPLTLVCSPEAHPAFENAYHQLETDPVLAERFRCVMEQKREEWRERESARKLVG